MGGCGSKADPDAVAKTPKDEQPNDDDDDDDDDQFDPAKDNSHYFDAPEPVSKPPKEKPPSNKKDRDLPTNNKKKKKDNDEMLERPSAPYSSNNNNNKKAKSDSDDSDDDAPNVQDMSVKELKRELKDQNVPLEGLVEKDDLRQAVKEARKKKGPPPKKNNNNNNTTKPKPPPTSSNNNNKPKTTTPPPSSSKTNNTTNKKKPATTTKPKKTPPAKPVADDSSSSSESSVSSDDEPVKPAKKNKKKEPEEPSTPAAPPTPPHIEPGANVVTGYREADPNKWKFEQVQFNGSSSYKSMGEQEEIKGKSITKAIARFKKNPRETFGMTFQTNMKTWPVDQQKYTLIHRENTVGYQPLDVGPKGWMTLIMAKYERCQPLPKDELPPDARDKYTDTMSYLGRKLHSPKNKPLLPGRGMGLGDTPDLKIIGDVDPNDINQGSVGDCWLLSAISALAEFDGAVKRLFRKTTRLVDRPLPDECNMYVITLYDLTTWKEVDVMVDERLCVQSNGSGRLLGASPSSDGELWVPYLEKALAAHCGGWDKIKGGQCTHGWALLTGCKEQYTIQINPKTGLYGCYAKRNPATGKWDKHANSPHDGPQNLYQVPWPDVGGGGSQDLTQDQLFQKMYAWDKENYIVGCGANGISDSNSTEGVVDNHAYSVLEAHANVAGTGIDLFKIRNPWGSGEMENGQFDDDGPGWDEYPQIKALLNPVVADDGMFFITKDEFFQFFKTVYLSASNMTAFLED